MDFLHLEKGQFCGFLKSIFLLSKKAYFLPKTLAYTFSQFILRKTKISENLKCLT